MNFLGRGHLNYDIQIIVVILKVTMIRPWIIERIIMIFLGSHMSTMNYKVIMCSALGGADSVVNNNNIGL